MRLLAHLSRSPAMHMPTSVTRRQLGDMGKFEGEVITIAGSMQGKDEETCLQP